MSRVAPVATTLLHCAWKHRLHHLPPSLLPYELPLRGLAAVSFIPSCHPELLASPMPHKQRHRCSIAALQHPPSGPSQTLPHCLLQAWGCSRLCLVMLGFALWNLVTMVHIRIVHTPNTMPTSPNRLTGPMPPSNTLFCRLLLLAAVGCLRHIRPQWDMHAEQSPKAADFGP